MARTEAHRDIAEAVETGLGSVAKLRMLRLMLENPERTFSFYEFEQKLAVKPVLIRKHMADLKKLGWVEELPYSPRKFRVNLNNEISKQLLLFFGSIGYTSVHLG